MSLDHASIVHFDERIYVICCMILFCILEKKNHILCKLYMGNECDVC